ncbi:hypothetical protein LCGC14_1686930 [marine sediment metagenome]|uniref:Helicase ATP-binding domain-containing protein n=1 Tax=marine sediment metagenome TaxID=412755 RepID=A0A0F9KM06_9ZZZZ
MLLIVKTSKGVNPLPSMNSTYLPRLYQEKIEILNQIISHLNNYKIGYINVPTGWGKTFLSKHLINRNLENGKKVLFITSRNKQLLSQTYYRDEPNEIPLFSNSICLSSDFSISKWEEDEIINYIQKNDIRLVFASLQTILSKKKKHLSNFFITYFQLFIIDEIHNFIKNKGNELIDEINLKNEDSYIFGMTATPTQGVIGNLKWVEEIHENMKQIYHKTISECILDRQLSPLNYSIIRNNVNIEDIFDFGENLKGLETTELYMDMKNIDQIIKKTQLAKQIYDEKIDPNSKTLIFCSPIRNIIQNIKNNQKKVQSFHAKLSSAIFNNEINLKFISEISLNNKTKNDTFKRAVFLSSDLKNIESKEIIRDFKNPNKPPFILCTVGKLVEGFDFPQLKNLILLRPTLSMRLFEQQVGRVIRKHELKDVGNIFEIVDSINFDSLYEKFGDLIFSDKKLKKILMLNPEHRIENLFIQKSDDVAVFNKKLVKVKEYFKEKIDIEKIEFKKSEKIFKEFIKQIPPLDFRVKIFLKSLKLISNKLEGKAYFENKLHILLDLASKFNMVTKNDFNKVIKLIPLIDEIINYVREDPNHSGNAKKYKPKLLNEISWFIKLKIISDLEKTHDLPKRERRLYLSSLGFKDSDINITNLKIACLDQVKRISPEKLLKSIKNSFKTINFLLKNMNSKSSPLDFSTQALTKIINISKGNLIWCEVFYLEEMSSIYNNVENQKVIKQFKIRI